MMTTACPTSSSTAASARASASPSLELLEARTLRDSLEVLLRKEQSAMAELARVVTEANWTEVAPRFFGLSAREAREVVAELQPRAAPPLRAVVTSLAPTLLTLGLPQATPPARLASLPGPSTCSPTRASCDTDPESLLTSEEELTHPARGLPPRDEVEPLTAELRRLHVTVSRQFLRKLEEARDGLSHVVPVANAERVLEAALDLLLEKQARARGQVKRPRTTSAGTAPCVQAPKGAAAAPRDAVAPLALIPNEPPPPRRTGSREAIPAAVRRSVWERDAGRCSWPVDGGGGCGSTHRLELDHVVPGARFGDSTPANLRVVCATHNRLAARLAFGAPCVERYAGALHAASGRDRGGGMP